MSSSSGIGMTEIGTESKLSVKGAKDNNTFVNQSQDTQSSLTSWRDKIEISIAKSRKIRGGNYVQIATVDPKTLEPRCRTVVFRGFLKPNPNQDNGSNHPLPCIMKMITDKRSNKFGEATNLVTNSAGDTPTKRSNNVEMVWWFSKSSEQYRIRGQLKFVGEDEADEYLLQSRKEQWGNLSDPAREQFYWVDPGLNYDAESSSAQHIPVGGRDEESGKVLPPPSNFLVMLLYPTMCDYLKLGDNVRQVDNLIEGNTWQSKRANP